MVAGKVYVILGSSLGTTSSIELSETDFTFLGEDRWDNAGCSVAMAGDVDGDGRSDLLIGAYESNEGGTQSGRTYLILSRL